MRSPTFGTEEQFVCVNCFDDPGMVEFVWANAVATECSFCDHRSDEPFAVQIEQVSEHFLECLFTEYDMAGNQLGWDGSEGGWIGANWDADELLMELEFEFPQDNHEELADLLFDEHADQQFCEANAYGLNDDAVAIYSWETFRRVTMTERRCFFMDYEDDDYEVYSPGEVLRAIFDFAQHSDLFKILPVGTRLFRARCEGRGPRLETPEELGAPLADRAIQANRMSPAGIPMFYACDEEATALKETANGPGCFAVGQFELTRDAILLDLTALSPVPSLFVRMSDSVEIRPRKALKFLHHVANQVSLPIERGDRNHVDYVPTQVVTEYVRSRITWEGFRIDGVRYESSVHPGHASYVLFANQANIHSTTAKQLPEDRWLKLLSVSHTHLDS